MRSTPPPGYELREGPPALADYLRLRAEPGPAPRTGGQAAAGLPGGWFACHVVHVGSDATVGMGRVIGDGGWYFHVIDLAVLPKHQRRGLGDLILTAILARIARDAPPGAIVN